MGQPSMTRCNLWEWGRCFEGDYVALGGPGDIETDRQTEGRSATICPPGMIAGPVAFC